MSLLDVERRLGKQTPTYALVPSTAVRSEADDAAFLSSGYGLTPDEWQHLVLQGWLAVRLDGRWAASRRGLAVARQNGKNGIIEIDQLFKMVELGRKILHTAHEVKTARKAFLRLLGFFDNRRQFPELADLVKEIRRTNGQEAIFLTNGASCEFIARSKNSGRGFTVDDLYCDEAQELSDETLAALRPTISAAPSGNPQITLTGTPPSPANNGEVFTRMRERAQEASDGRLCWHEWSNEPEADLDSDEVLAAANPALGIRLGWETVDDERSDMDDETFGRERAGIWGGGGGGVLLDPDTWRGFERPGSQPGQVLAFGVAVSADRKSAWIGVAGRRPDGAMHVELVSCCKVHRQTGGWCAGTAWVPKRLRALEQKWKPAHVVLDPGSPAGALIVGLANEKVELLLVSGREYAQACGEFYGLFNHAGLAHLGQPELNAAADGARKRKLGDSWAWGWKDASVDVSPLSAVTLAAHGADKPPKKKRKTGRAMSV